MTRTQVGPSPRSRPAAAAPSRTVSMTYREAMREAMRDAMRADERVFLMGEDVGAYGGCFGVSLGLLEEFGPQRVRDTPLSEAAFVGAGIGAALGGMRPIVEIMTVNFSLLALDQILNTAATLLHMSGGQFNVPLVIRMTTGAGRQLAAQHSHSLENYYAHIPGLRVLAPGTVADARGMLAPALADPDPVVIFEHGSLTYGGSLPTALAAAELLARDDVSAEVVDLRVLRPLDMGTVLASVRRTHRVVVVDENWRTLSIAGEVCAQVAEDTFYDLDAPVQRVCSVEVPMPYARHLELAALPSVDRVRDAVRTVLAGA